MRAAALAIGFTLLLFGFTGAASADPLFEGVTPLDTLAEQQALLGCGPLWGTECTGDGVDLTGMESSVLLHPWVLGVPLPDTTLLSPYGRVPIGPGTRGPEGPCEVSRENCLDGVVLWDPATFIGSPNELSASSYNFLMMIAELSGDIDPDDPFSTESGVCSYAQLMSCPFIYAAFAPEPDAALAALAALATLGGLRMRRRPRA